MEEKIQQVYRESKTYPELAAKFAGIGIMSYSVEVSTGITVFRFEEDGLLVQHGHLARREVAGMFDPALTLQALTRTQQGKTTYPQFMDEIAEAGVRFYEATLTGRKRVTYIGVSGEYEEEIPAWQASAPTRD